MAIANLTDQMHVTGTATLAGLVTINAIGASGGPQPGNRSTLLIYADGGVTNTATLNTIMYVPTGTAPSNTAVFHPYISTTPLADATLSQVTPYPVAAGDGLYLNYTVDYAPDGLTSNQHNVGAAVNLIQAFGAPAYQPVAQQIFIQPDLISLGRIYDLISGEGTVAAQQASFGAQSSFLDAIFDHAGQNLDCDPTKPETCEKRWHVWSQASGSRGDASGTTNAAMSRSSSIGLTLGADYRVQPGMALGFAFGSMWPQYRVPDRLASGEATGANMAFYGMAQSHFGTYVKAGASFGALDNWETRMAWQTPVQASYLSKMVGSRVELGQRIGIDDLALTPFGGLQASILHQDRYAESDGVWGNLFHAHRQQSMPVFAGLLLDATLHADNGVAITPSLRGQWSRETIRSRSIEAESLAAPGFTWAVNGTDAPRDTRKFDAALTVTMPDALKLKAAFTAERSGQTRSIGGLLRLDYSF